MFSKQTQHNQSEKEVNPWIFAEADSKKELVQELEKVIHDAEFIPDEKEKNWILLLPYLSEDFLKELKQSIIRESLRHLDPNYKL